MLRSSPLPPFPAFVDDQDVDPTYSALKQALCDAGSTAAVCSGLVRNSFACEI